MTEKIEFGVAYLYLMREMEHAASPDGGLDNISDAALNVFLVLWGLTGDDIIQAHTLFTQRLDKGELGDLTAAVRHVIRYIGEDKRERLVMEMGGVGFMDFAISAQEKALVNFANMVVDMKPSEYYPLLDRGRDLSKALHMFGSVYKQEMMFSFDESTDTGDSLNPDSPAPGASGSDDPESPTPE